MLLPGSVLLWKQRLFLGILRYGKQQAASHANEAALLSVNDCPSTILTRQSDYISHIATQMFITCHLHQEHQPSIPAV